jgi:hypothetical protein
MLKKEGYGGIDVDGGPTIAVLGWPSAEYEQATVRGKQAAADTVMLYDEVANECVKECIGVRRKIL